MSNSSSSELQPPGYLVTVGDLPGTFTGSKTEAARCGDYEVRSRAGAVFALARMMLDDTPAMPDLPMLVCGLDGRLRFTVNSLHAAARSTIADSGAGAPRVVPWEPFPAAVFRPAPEAAQEQL